MWRAILATVCLVWTSVGHADFVQVDWTGVVDRTSGTGFGFAVGDVVSGQIRFDPAGASVVDCFPVECDYEIAGITDSLFGSGSGIRSFLNVADGNGSACSNPCDNYRLSSRLTTTNADGSEYSRSTFLWAHDDVTDFISGTGIDQSFSLTQADITFNGIMFGELRELLFDSLGNLLTNNRASYLLTSMKVSTVPEPATWALLGIGVAALALSQRRRRAAPASAVSPST